MWIMVMLLPMAYLIGKCIGAVPKKYRKVPIGIGWFFILPCLMASINPIAQYSRSPLPLIYDVMILVGTLSCYYVTRGMAFLGMIGTYNWYGRENRYTVPMVNILFGWILTILEPVLMATIFLLAYFIEYPGALNVPGMSEIMMLVSLTLTLGIVLSYLFLVMMYSERKKIFKTAQPKTVPSGAKPPFQSGRIEASSLWKGASPKPPSTGPSSSSQKLNGPPGR